MSQAVSEVSVSSETLKVTLLADRWTSSAGGLPTLNRELAIQLSQHPKVEVSFLIPDGHCTDEDKSEAQSFGITVVGAKKRPGWTPLEWLSAPPRGHKIDVVIGHGAKLGRQVPFIKDSDQHHNCKWIQVAHTAPEDLYKYKGYPYPIVKDLVVPVGPRLTERYYAYLRECERNIFPIIPIVKGEEKHEVEVDLCKLADLVVPVGPRLEERYSAYLRGRERNIFPIIPGLFDREFGYLEHSPNEDATFRVLLCGSFDDEDFELKGYDIAAKAFTDHRLRRKPYHLILVGVPEGKHEEVRQWFLQYGIAEEQLTVRKFVQSREKMKHLLCEVNLVIRPSRSEAFDLVALEALSAGLPILVNENSGFAGALENIPLGTSCIVDSDDPARWAEAIEGVRFRHRVRLEEIKILRTSYDKRYNWKEQCGALVERMQRIVDGRTVTDSDSQFIPSYVLARGEAYKAAYLRALETGETTDKRVKVLLIGQDRVGKTSVGRSLKGETFDKNESSTDGVQIDKALKNVSKFPWKNPIEEKEITAFHHKCGLYISTDLSTPESAQQEEVDDKTHLAGVGDSTPSGHESKDNILVLEENSRSTKKRQEPSATQQGKNEEIDSTTKHQKRQGKNESATRPIEVPENIKRVTENILKGEAENSDKIWPVIFDFAGQAIYRATHPIFVSSEAIYVLVLDLSKDLSDIAQCYVREPDCGEVRIAAPDNDDTNLDHIMRWLDLVHSFEHTENRTVLPPVILVGTHADLVKDNPCGKMAYLLDNVSNTVEAFSEHILEETFVVDNTRSGQEHDNEDPQIISLRNKILEVGEGMPHTKKKVPLKWLQLEDIVEGRARKGENYITRLEFKTDIFDEICPSESADDFDALLLFLHDRGSVIYHDCTNDRDSLVVLNPRWLTNVLRQIITVEKQTKDKLRIRNLRRKLERDGILDKELLDHSCESLGVTNIKESLLFIMKKFNLLCQLDCQDGNSMYLVPCMLTSKRHDVLTSNIPANPALAPVYITFDTRYVPIGLFSRLIVLFVEFASRKVKCDQPRLRSNFARFFIGDVTAVEFVCYRRVIQVHVYDFVNVLVSNPVEKEPYVCSELFSFLKSGLKKLQEECHWLKAVSWDLSARCNLCPAEFVTEKEGCIWHQREDCSHFDCAHFVSLTKKPVVCKRTDGPIFCPPKTWSQALEVLSQPGASVEGNTLPSASGSKRMLSSCGTQVSKQRNLDVTDYEVKDGAPSEEELQTLSPKLKGDEWKKLGRVLEFEDADLTAFDRQNP